MRVLVSGTTRWQPLLAALVSGLSIFAAAAAEFTSPTLGTSLNEPSDLEIQNVQLLNQLPLADGRVLLEASATASNRAEGLWSSVTVGYRVSIDLGPYQVLASTIDFPGTLASNSTPVATGGMHLLVSTTSLSSARDELLSGGLLVLYGTDQNGQRVANPTNDLALINHRILGELAVSANKTLLVFAAGVQNLGSNRWTQLSIGLDAALATNEFSVAASAATFPATLPPMGSLSNSPPFYAAVASNDVATAVSNILSGAALTRSGFELFVFNAPPRGIDAHTEDAWLPRASTLLGVTPLSATRDLVQITVPVREWVAFWTVGETRVQALGH